MGVLFKYKYTSHALRCPIHEFSVFPPLSSVCGLISDLKLRHFIQKYKILLENGFEMLVDRLMIRFVNYSYLYRSNII